MTIDLFSDHNERLRVDLNAAELLRDAEQPEPRLNRRKLKLLNRSLLSFALLDLGFISSSSFLCSDNSFSLNNLTN